jgi:hypothetical protein
MGLLYLLLLLLLLLLLVVVVVAVATGLVRQPSGHISNIIKTNLGL